MLDLVKEARLIDINSIDNPPNEFYTEDLPLLALQAIDQGLIEQFDTIIIDEGQDLIRAEYLDVFDALLKGGLAGGKWQIFCDFERQAIYSELSSIQMLELIEQRSAFASFNLSINCRNTSTT